MDRTRYPEYVQRFSGRLAGDGKSKNTVASYTRDVGEFLSFLDALGSARIDQITEEQVAGFIDGLRARDMGERSKAKKLTSIRSFFVWARGEGILDSYPRKLSYARIKQALAARAAAPIARAAGA